MRYLSKKPAKPPRPGLVLCHNRVRHNHDTTPGINGFRVWLATELPDDFVVCRCGWAPDAGVHFAHKDCEAAKG